MGHQQHHDLGRRPPHAELRRQLSPAGSCSAIWPPGSSAATASTSASPATPSPTCCSGTTRASACSSRPAFSVPGAAGQSARVQLQVLRAVRAGRLARELQAHRQPGAALGLPQRALRDQEPHGLAQSATTRRGGLLVADETLVDGGIVGRRATTSSRAAATRRTRIGSRSSRRGSASRGGPSEDGKTVVRGGYGVFFDSAEGREIDGAADVYPYVSRGNYQQSVGQPTPLQTTDALFPSFADAGRGDAGGQHVPGREPVAASRATRTCSNGRSACSARCSPAPSLEVNYIGNKGTNLLMRRNIAQALPVQRRPSRRSPSASRSRTSASTSTATGAGGRTTTRFNTKLEHRGARGAADLRLHLGEEHRHQVGGGGHRRDRLQRLAGVPRQPRSGARSRPVGLRRGSPAGRRASSTTCRSATARSSPAMPPASRRRWSAAGR